MPKVTPNTPPRRLPDYYSRGQGHFFNRDLEEFEVFSEGEYVCTVHVSDKMPPKATLPYMEQKRMEAWDRAKLMIPGLVNMEQVELRYIKHINETHKFIALCQV